MKKIISIILVMVSIFVMSGSAFAAEQEKNYVIVNGEQVVYEDQDYNNPETGEYIHWVTNTNARGATVKTFTYKVRYSVKSSKFTVGSTSLKVVSDAHVEDVNGNWQSGYTGHKYRVEITGLKTKYYNFSISKTESGTQSGFKKGGSYTVTVVNEDYLSSYYYLVGSGTVSNN